MNIFINFINFIYFIIVFGLGIRMLLINNKSSKFLGGMAVSLSIVSEIVLLPLSISLFMSNLSFDFDYVARTYIFLIISIFMLVFFIFYYLFLSSFIKLEKKECYFLILFLILEVLIFIFTQLNINNILISIIFRNVGIIVFGILLYSLSLKEKDNKIIKKSRLFLIINLIIYILSTIFLQICAKSIAFFIISILFFLIVSVMYFKQYKVAFDIRSIGEFSIISLIFGLLSGVFSREITKYFRFSGNSILYEVHPHLFILGFLSMLLIYVWLSNGQYSKNIEKFNLKNKIYLWISGLCISTIIFILRGIIEVTNYQTNHVVDASISGISGIGHILIGIGMVWTILYIFKEKGIKE